MEPSPLPATAPLPETSAATPRSHVEFLKRRVFIASLIGAFVILLGAGYVMWKNLTTSDIERHEAALRRLPTNPATSAFTAEQKAQSVTQLPDAQLGLTAEQKAQALTSMQEQGKTLVPLF